MTPLLILAQTPAAPSMLDSVKAIGEQFGFAWPLFLSNCVSFFIVCILLRKFAYKPVVEMLEQRRDKIPEAMKNAERIKTELADAEKKKADILAQANVEAQRMIEEARTSAAIV